MPLLLSESVPTKLCSIVYNDYKVHYLIVKTSILTTVKLTALTWQTYRKMEPLHNLNYLNTAIHTVRAPWTPLLDKKKSHTKKKSNAQ